MIGATNGAGGSGAPGGRLDIARVYSMSSRTAGGTLAVEMPCAGAIAGARGGATSSAVGIPSALVRAVASRIALQTSPPAKRLCHRMDAQR